MSPRTEPSMPRAWSHDPEPHRDFVRLTENVQRGDDVRTVEGKTELRLEARDLHGGRPVGRDGILTAGDFDAAQVAARYLGVLEEVLKRTDRHGREVLTVGAQRIIVDPGSRSPAQLDRAAERMEQLVENRRKRAEQRRREPGRLSAAQRSDARERFEHAMRLALNNRGVVHYTQGVRRWDGIRLGLRSADGKYPRYADCSSITTWALWNALTGASGDMAFPDVVNGASWDAGYTGTQTTHGEVVSLGSLMVGDLVFYGRAWPYGHVAGYVGGGMVISHGSESGPHFLPVRYRGDVSHARRFIL